MTMKWMMKMAYFTPKKKEEVVVKFLVCIYQALLTLIEVITILTPHPSPFPPLRADQELGRQRVVVHGQTKRFLLHINLNLTKHQLLLDSTSIRSYSHNQSEWWGKFLRTAILSALIHDISESAGPSIPRRYIQPALDK